uniref:Uncharacterized protein n=1 Tax=Siphoviridae sp. ctOkv13 TaxID=2826314 RepID=A0A8S5M317_9CAUD|nr:MAG TPA: hypothetical protein [Siphoviridae sp. ctOkv13]
MAEMRQKKPILYILKAVVMHYISMLHLIFVPKPKFNMHLLKPLI